MKVSLILTGIFSCFLIGTIVTAVHDYAALEDNAREAKIEDYQSGQHAFKKNLWIGGPLTVHREEHKEKSYIEYTIFNRAYKYTTIDYNKSKIIGSFIGSRTKQFGKGIVSGLSETSKFDK